MLATLAMAERLSFVAVRYEEYALLKVYQQEVVQGYINRNDIRMTPNTFEGLTLGGKLGSLDYLGRAYLTVPGP